MLEEINFNSLKEFLDFNESIIHENYYAFYPSIQLAQMEDVKIIQLYNLKDNDGSYAICMHMSYNYYFFSTKFTDRFARQLSNKIKLKKFRNYTFYGQRELMTKLLSFSNINFEIEKDRLIYECEIINNLSDLKGKLVLAEVSDFEELSKMSYEFQLEEYGSKAHRDYEYMSNVVRSGINKQSIYKIIDNDCICSMAQIFNTESEFPMVGHLFTDKKYRNNGYATSIIFQLTQLLLNWGYKKCGLRSDVANTYSNKVFQKVGYKSVFKEISVYKND